jgi:hypothetical protein
MSQYESTQETNLIIINSTFLINRNIQIKD